MDKVLVVDDHPMIRLAVHVLLERHGYEVVGEADNGLDAIQIARDSAPDLVVLDIGIPKLDGLEVISRLKHLDNPPQVLVLTSQPASALGSRCMTAGAAGFVCKDEHLGGVLSAVKAVLSGYTYFPTTLINSVVRPESANNEHDLLSKLSDRELMVLQQLAQGLSNKQIATTMILSSKTISTYKSRLQQKLNVPNLLGLVEFAKRNQLG